MVLIYTQGPNSESIGEHRVRGYIVTLRPQRDGTYYPRWDYPNDPQHPNDSMSAYSRTMIEDLVSARKWIPFFPAPIRLPEGI